MPGERNGKEEMEHTFYRRLLSAVCAIALAFTAVCPAVAAAPEDTTGTPQTLTVSEVQEMQQTDAAVTALTVQDTVNVSDFRVLDREWVLAQAHAIIADLPVAAVIGQCIGLNFGGLQGCGRLLLLGRFGHGHGFAHPFFVQAVVVPRASACGGGYVKAVTLAHGLVVSSICKALCKAGCRVDRRKYGFANPVTHGLERRDILGCQSFFNRGCQRFNGLCSCFRKRFFCGK